MKTKAILSCILALALSSAFAVAGPMGTAFTYQGQLNDGGASANGRYDLKFTLYDNAGGGMAVAGPVTNSPVGVTNGLFITTLDFGPNAFTGDARWLHIAVRTNGGGAFTPLDPRQPLTPSPYAIYASKAALLDGLLPASQLSGLYPNALTLNNPANSFSGSGAGLTGLNATQLTTGTVPAAALSNAWKIGGNAGTTAGTHFLGTTDNQPLELKVNNQRALRLEYATDDFGNASPNVIGGRFNTISTYGSLIGGGLDNVIGANSPGSAVAGGYANDIGINSPFSTVAGGEFNTIAADSVYSTIGGGFNNDIGITSGYSAIGGGASNAIGTTSHYSTIGGGYDNTIGTDSRSSTIAGGLGNDIGTNSDYSAIGGGSSHSIATDSAGSTIAGGNDNTIGSNSLYSTIGGGLNNDIGTTSPFSTLAGGDANDIGPDSAGSTIAGGINNDLGTNSDYSAIGGGANNTIAANSFSSAIAGGWGNLIAANSPYATIPGGRSNVATNYAFAAGRRAKANHTGAFVWADATDEDFFSRDTNQFLIRASGGVGIGTNATAGAMLNVLGLLRATTFQGDGIGLGNLSAANLTSGTLPDARLSANVSRLGPSIESGELADNAVTGAKIADGAIAAADVNAASFNTTFWRVNGNAGTTGGTPLPRHHGRPAGGVQGQRPAGTAAGTDGRFSGFQRAA